MADNVFKLEDFRKKKPEGKEVKPATDPEEVPRVQLRDTRPREERMTPEEDLADRKAFVGLLTDMLEGKPSNGAAIGEGGARVKKSSGVYGDLSGHSEETLKKLYRQAKAMNNKPAYLQALQDEARRRGTILY